MREFSIIELKSLVFSRLGCDFRAIPQTALLVNFVENVQNTEISLSLDQRHSTKVGQVGVPERKTQCSQGLWHPAKVRFRCFARFPQSSLKVRFVEWHENRTQALKTQDFSTL